MPTPCARCPFDALYQPLPMIQEILEALGTVADSWVLAAGFHFRSGRIGKPGSAGNLVDDAGEHLAVGLKIR